MGNDRSGGLFPAPVPTITIPVAEYEELKRRAKVYEALSPADWREIRRMLVGSSTWRSRVYRALTAAIKEQEGVDR